MNKRVILVNGPSGSGKTATLRNLDFSKTIYLNLDAKTELPFGGELEMMKFLTPKSALQVNVSLQELEETDADTIVVDTLSFYITALESEVAGKENGFDGWATYSNAIKELLDFSHRKSKKSWIFLSHTQLGDSGNLQAMVKGSMKNLSIESYFSTVLELFTYELATPNHFDSVVGYGMQTKKTLENRKSSAKSPFGLFPRDGKIMNNDIDLVLRRLSGEKIDWDDNEVLFAKDKQLIERLNNQ